MFIYNLGQVGAWMALPSSYAVEVMDESDIANAVNFARIHNLRLVVKGTGRHTNICDNFKFSTGVLLLFGFSVGFS